MERDVVLAPILRIAVFADCQASLQVERRRGSGAAPDQSGRQCENRRCSTAGMQWPIRDQHCWQSDYCAPPAVQNVQNFRPATKTIAWMECAIIILFRPTLSRLTSWNVRISLLRDLLSFYRYFFKAFVTWISIWFNVQSNLQVFNDVISGFCSLV